MSGKNATTSLSLSPRDGEGAIAVLTPISDVFPAVGVVDLEPGLASPEFQAHLAAFDRWLAQGHHGAMDYLRRGRDRRADPRLLFPAAQSVLCVLEPYAKSPYGETAPQVGPRYARYLRGTDYHERIARRLDSALQDVRARFLPELTWKVCVDTSAVLERAWAQLCGLGWIGKNSLLIHPQLGSYAFIGVAFLSQAFGREPEILADYCGSCERCLTTCPTQAITRHKTILSRQCIAYWTLEKRGELDLDSTDRMKMSNWVAGCDLCQEVCPFNFKPVKNEVAPAETAPLRTYLEHLRETEAQYRARVRDSALSRVKPAQFKRNLLLALENSLGAETWDLIDLPEDLNGALLDLESAGLTADLMILSQRCRQKIAALQTPKRIP